MPEMRVTFHEELDALCAEVQKEGDLVLRSLRASLNGVFADPSPNADLNHRISTAMLAYLGEQPAATTGLVRSAWLDRISRTAGDAEGMIDELLRME